MGRTIEWILAVIGTVASMSVLFFFGSRADLWAVAIMAGVALAGFLGFVAVALDEKGKPRMWGSITWVVAGVMSAMAILAGFSYGVFLIPAALAFLGAALLAYRRRERSLGRHVAFYLAGALGCTLVVVLGNVLGRI